MMLERSCLNIILAAGEGKRMQSDMHKVLHLVGGLSMVCHVIDCAKASGSNQRAVVIGPDGETVEDCVIQADPEAQIFIQNERLGTAHAVLAARESIAKGADDIVILYGDTPLLRSESILQVRQQLADGADLAVIGFKASEPTGYGRLLVEDGRLVAIREHRDATPKEQDITLCNSGVMAFSGRVCLELLDAVDNKNVQDEFYLTDVVEIANAKGLKVVVSEADEDDVLGVNNRVQLASVEAIYQKRRRHQLMLEGVTMIAPDTVTLSYDTLVGRDVIIEPQVFFGPGVEIAAGAIICAFSHLEGCRIASGAIIGPFARLRPGADIGEKARIGNFCEIKNAKIEEDAKVNHLSYIGDAHIGASANIGAGTITCNYDGFNKFQTIIGAGAFIGSNSALVAPIRIGEGGYVASGSVVTRDVEPDALAVARSKQVEKQGWARKFRALNKKKL